MSDRCSSLPFQTAEEAGSSGSEETPGDQGAETQGQSAAAQRGWRDSGGLWTAAGRLCGPGRVMSLDSPARDQWFMVQSLFFIM